METKTLDIRDENTRFIINGKIAHITDRSFLSPYIPWELVCKALLPYKIFPEKVSFSGVDGIVVQDVNQFGIKSGMTDDAKFNDIDGLKKDETHGEPSSEGQKDEEGKHDFQQITKVAKEDDNETYHLYFEYQLNEYGLYDVFCEIITDLELDELDAEEASIEE